jgi:hypothetical protein
MHPYLSEQLVHDRQAALVHEAEREALAKAARAAAAGARPTPERDDRFHLMPHVRQRGGLRRVVASLLRPSAA